MKNIPEMISTKDIAYIKDMFNWNYILFKKYDNIKDMFNWNYILFKKYDNYLENIEDEEICKLTNELSNLHFNNCNELLNLLEGSDNCE